MAIFTSPLRFTPFPRPMVWGGRKLASLLNKTLPTEENYGESWEISDHPLHRSVVAMGPLAGATLHSLIEQHPQDILGTGRSSFPWLIKFLDARDWLSVQVHPDDALAQKLRPGESGKTEAWFVVAAEPGSRIYAGVKSGVQPDEFREAVARAPWQTCCTASRPGPAITCFCRRARFMPSAAAWCWRKCSKTAM